MDQTWTIEEIQRYVGKLSMHNEKLNKALKFNITTQQNEFMRSEPIGSRDEVAMIWNGDINVDIPTLPKPYILHVFEDKDEEQYNSLLGKCALSARKSPLDNILKNKLAPNNIFVIYDKDTDVLVGTTCAMDRSSDSIKQGELGWMAVRPEYQGKGFGTIVGKAVLDYFNSLGYSNIYLLTNAKRIPAIKTYFKLNFRPHIRDHKDNLLWIAFSEEVDWRFY